MTALLLVILTQAPVEERIDAFAKGDAAAKESLLKLGVFAIRPLQKARAKAPDKIDALVFELKKIASYPKDSPVAGKLAEKGEFMYGKVGYQEAVGRLQMRGGYTVVFDDLDPKDLVSDKVTVELSDATAREALDHICRQAGLDYGFFHNVLLVSTSARLWPEDRKLARTFGPPAADRQHMTPEDGEALKKLKSIKINLDFQNADVGVIAMYLKEIGDVPIKVEGDPEKTGLTLRAKEQSIYDMVCVITQVRGLDFMMREGGVVIDTRDAIEKKIAGKK